LYQLDTEKGVWNTINYSSRALTKTEQRYAAMEGESLAILQGVTANRMFLYGIPIVVVTDHKPLVNLYNNPKKQGPARVEHHHLKLQGYRFEVKYEKGETNPTDYNSRHPIPLTQEQKDLITEDAFFVNTIIDNDIPDVLTEKMVQDSRIVSYERLHSRFSD